MYNCYCNKFILYFIMLFLERFDYKFLKLTFQRNFLVRLNQPNQNDFRRKTISTRYE